MGIRRAPIALLLVGSLWGGAAGAADVIAKDRFLLGSHLDYARLVLSLRPPHPRNQAVRLDPRDQHPGEQDGKQQQGNRQIEETFDTGHEEKLTPPGLRPFPAASSRPCRSRSRCSSG